MKLALVLFCFVSVVLASCNPVTPIAPSEPLEIRYTSASLPWVAELQACAGDKVLNAVQVSAIYLEPSEVDLAIRIGVAENSPYPAYQIGTDELIVIVNSLNPIISLTTGQVAGIFTGQIQNWQEIGESPQKVEVWSFPPGEDIQGIFEQSTLGGEQITSGAHLAMDPDEMLRAISDDVNAIGILSKRWVTEIGKVVFTIGTVPVLALTPSEPEGEAGEILACLQKRNQ